jgi:hypothetical protein
VSEEKKQIEVNECDHEFDYDHCKNTLPCLKCGISPREVRIATLPWRKPEERPEVGRELILAEAHCDPEKKPVLYEGRVTQNGEVYLPYTECEHKLESFLCWIYADEIPLPDWCLK